MTSVPESSEQTEYASRLSRRRIILTTAAVMAGMFYGATLSAYTPLGAIMAALAPDRKGAAMSILNFGAGASAWVGPAIAGIFLPIVGVGGVMWIYAVLYLISAALTWVMKVPEDK